MRPRYETSESGVRGVVREARLPVEVATLGKQVKLIVIGLGREGKYLGWRPTT